MFDLILLAMAVSLVCLWFYCYYRLDTSDKREKKAIKKALKDAGYV